MICYIDDVWEICKNNEISQLILTIDGKSYEASIQMKCRTSDVEGVTAIPYVVEIYGKNRTIYKQNDRWFCVKNGCNA